MTETKTFTPDEEKLLWALHDEVSEAGANHIYDKTERGDEDYFQTSCTYVNYRDGGNKASCLIGRAMVRSGLSTVTKLTEYEGTAAHSIMPDTIGSFVATAASSMQRKQDKGHTWEFAYTQGLLSLAISGYDVARFMLD